MRFPALASLVSFILLASGFQAQSTNAFLTGRVIDQSKALIAGAKVAAISTDTDGE